MSTRERPILPVELCEQIEQDHLKLLPFEVAAIPCLALGEIVAEKIGAASQRLKIRDLHDLAEVSRIPPDRDLTRTLAVLKLWNTLGPGLDFERFRQCVQGRRNYEIADLQHLLGRGENPDLEGMIRQVLDEYQFLCRLTELEQILAVAQFQRHRDEAAQVIPPLSKKYKNDVLRRSRDFSRRSFAGSLNRSSRGRDLGTVSLIGLMSLRFVIPWWVALSSLPASVSSTAGYSVTMAQRIASARVIANLPLQGPTAFLIAFLPRLLSHARSQCLTCRVVN